MDEMSFPEMIQLRKKLSMPQSDMALYLGVKNKLTISHWENGFRSPSEPVRRLVKHLNSLSFVNAKRLLIDLQKQSQE
jgi:DNA-binding transcriptional regulator YiaG